jgi:hypothetical protein
LHENFIRNDAEREKETEGEFKETTRHDKIVIYGETEIIVVKLLVSYTRILKHNNN